MLFEPCSKQEVMGFGSTSSIVPMNLSEHLEDAARVFTNRVERGDTQAAISPPSFG